MNQKNIAILQDAASARLPMDVPAGTTQALLSRVSEALGGQSHQEVVAAARTARILLDLLTKLAPRSVPTHADDFENPAVQPYMVGYAAALTDLSASLSPLYVDDEFRAGVERELPLVRLLYHRALDTERLAQKAGLGDAETQRRINQMRAEGIVASPANDGPHELTASAERVLEGRRKMAAAVDAVAERRSQILQHHKLIETMRSCGEPLPRCFMDRQGRLVILGENSVCHVIEAGEASFIVTAYNSLEDALSASPPDFVRRRPDPATIDDAYMSVLDVEYGAASPSA